MPYSLTPVELLVSGHFDTGVLPPFEHTWTTSTTRAFRGSIARPPTSLSTLRRRPYGIGPRKTRFRLVANLCRAGFTPAGFHLKGFRFVSYCLHRFPLSQAWPGAQALALQKPAQLHETAGMLRGQQLDAVEVGQQVTAQKGLNVASSFPVRGDGLPARREHEVQRPRRRFCAAIRCRTDGRRRVITGWTDRPRGERNPKWLSDDYVKFLAPHAERRDRRAPRAVRG